MGKGGADGAVRTADATDYDGFCAVTRLRDLAAEHPECWEGNTRIDEQLEALTPYLSRIERIESFWLDPDHRAAGIWAEHQDINRVMLATCLVPGGYLCFAEGH